MYQISNVKLFDGESGTVTQTVATNGGSFAAIDVVSISGTLTVKSGIVGTHALAVKNASTDATEATISAAGLWWVFVSPYEGVTVDGSSIGAGDEIFLGIQ